MNQEEIKKHLRKYFKTAPFEPYDVIVNYDIDSGEKPSVMWVAYHEFENDPKKGYMIAYDENDKNWHVIEWMDDKYEHVCVGGGSFAEAFNSM